MRLSELKKEVRESCDLVLLHSNGQSPNMNLLYFSGYTGAGVLGIPMKGMPFLLVSRMEAEKAKATGIRTYTFDRKKMLEMLSGVTRKYRRIGIDKENVNLLFFEKLRKSVRARYNDISRNCNRVRAVKDNDEIRAISRACRVTDKVFSKIVSKFSFKSEGELKRFIIREILSNGCEPSFPPIVASGRGSSNPHYDEERKIGRGFLLLDFGASYRRYCSDMSRTIYVGNPSKKEIKDYSLLLDAQLACISFLKKGVDFGSVFDRSVECLGDRAEFFLHSLGHGLGLNIHELPNIGPDDEQKLENKMIFTIEPGIYFENRYGIRIEDTILFDKQARVLTKSSKKLIRVGA